MQVASEAMQLKEPHALKLPSSELKTKWLLSVFDAYLAARHKSAFILLGENRGMSPALFL